MLQEDTESTVSRRHVREISRVPRGVRAGDRSSQSPCRFSSQRVYTWRRLCLSPPRGTRKPAWLLLQMSHTEAQSCCQAKRQEDMTQTFARAQGSNISFVASHPTPTPVSAHFSLFTVFLEDQVKGSGSMVRHDNVCKILLSPVTVNSILTLDRLFAD